MPRSTSPAELSPHERTALWVRAQANQAYEHPRPPSPTRASIQTSSSYRTTSSSEESYQRSPVMPSAISPYATQGSSTLPPRPRYDAHSRRASLPFPQSPPGSGYPVPLEVALPRHAKAEADEKQTPRPSLRKQRRPSLIEQIISLGSPSQRRSREESVRRGQT
ncbi:hypothetical protein C8Q78DRAFT_1076725 [Trametes maxima]|nr:hypothetical protein C8Q78DRAFT_1076725 [Trametes maxima]